MDDPRIVDWLRLQRNILSKLYVEKAVSGEYPHYGEVSPLSLKAVMDRKVRTLIYHADRDDEALEVTEATHRKQAAQVTAQVPILEKLAFIEDWAVIVRHHVEQDPETEDFRVELLKRVAEAVRYTKITTRSVELDRKMAELSGDSA